MDIVAAGGTDIGRKRALNEDFLGIFNDLRLYVVADGMGGHAAGEVASRTAVEAICEFVSSTAGKEDISWPFAPEPGLPAAANRLVSGVMLSNREIFLSAQRNPEQRGMGTTVVAALADGPVLHVAHVGDSRAYVLTGGSLRRVTTDHSYVEEMAQAGLITPAQMRTHPLRNIVTRALGTREDVKVDVRTHELAPGDIYLLCTDGLSGMLPDSEIERLLTEHAGSPSACVKGLIAAANECGGDDNITAIVLRVFGSHEISGGKQ